MIRSTAFVFGAAVVAGVVLTASAQSSRPEVRRPHKTVLDRLNDAASAAQTHEPVAVRRLMDQALDSVSILHIRQTHSVRNRVFQAEQAFRHGRHQSITEQDVVGGMNAIADLVAAPGWARTDVSQLHLFRLLLKPHVPQLIGTRPSDRGGADISVEMSPAEAVFVALFLANSKGTNEDYQVVPDEWVRRTLEGLSRRRQRVSPDQEASRPQLAFTLERPETASFRRIVEQGLADESSEVTTHAHAFLDRLGLQR